MKSLNDLKGSKAYLLADYICDYNTYKNDRKFSSRLLDLLSDSFPLWWDYDPVFNLIPLAIDKAISKEYTAFTFQGKKE